MRGASVLVGVDGSAASCDAAVLGRRLARAAAGTLHLVTAAEDILVEVAAVRSRLATEDLRREIVAAARRRAVDALVPEFDVAELEASLTVRLGRPERVIVELGKEIDAGIVLLGGRRHQAPGAWFDRGTAHHLLRSCSTPLLVTGPEGSRVERILAAIDLSFASKPTIDVASQLSSLLDVPLEVLYVVSPPRLPSEIEVHVDVDDLVRREAERAEAGLSELAPAGARRTIVHGGVVASIREAVREAPALVVLGAQGRGWIDRLLLGSTTEALLAELPCSLAIVPSSPKS